MIQDDGDAQGFVDDTPQTGVSEISSAGADDPANVADGHGGRLALLIARHRMSLLAYVKRILQCAEDAEDVVQEACVRLMRVHVLWRSEREVRAFLFKIATNLARDELRRRRARGYGMHLPYDTLDLVGDEPQPDEIVDRGIAMKAITRALLSLPPRYRQVFNLHVQGQLSYRAIACRLGISTKTVERDMSSVQQLCQDRLNAQSGRPTWPLQAKRLVACALFTAVCLSSQVVTLLQLYRYSP